MTTLATMRTRIADELELSGGGAEIPARLIDAEILSAIRHYETDRMRWNEAQHSKVATTTAATRIYTFSASWLKFDAIKIVDNGSYIPLKLKTWAEIEDMDLDESGSESTPTCYAIHSNTVRLYPVPDGPYTLIGSGVRRLTELSGDTDTNGWMTYGEELIRARARASIRINLLGDARSKAELAVVRNPFLSAQEERAYSMMRDETLDALATRRIRPYAI